MISRIIALVLLSAWSVGAGTYYIDWAAGSDANNGTSTSTPWKRAPFMRTFSGSYSHTAGDKFVLKGGSVWPRTCFQMRITQGGMVGNPDIYLSTNTWGSGMAIFDLESTSVGTGDANSAVLVEANYVLFSGIQIKNHRQESAYQRAAMVVRFSGTGEVVFQNGMINDWSVPSPIPKGLGSFGGAIWWTGGGGLLVVRNSEFHQMNVASKNGITLSAANVVEYNEIHHTATGWNGIGTVRYNHIHDMVGSGDPDSHQEAIHTFGISQVYGNVIHTLEGRVAAIELSPGYFSSSGTEQCYNNLIYNTQTQPPIWIKMDRANYSGITLQVFNNTIFCGGTALSIHGEGGQTLGTAVVRNNHWITSADPTAVDSVTSFTETDNLTQTASAANASGYTLANQFAPQSSGAPTVGTGANLSAFFSVDRIQNERTVPFDIGCYEWSGAPAAGKLSLEFSSLETVEDTMLSVSVIRTAGSSGTINVNYATSPGTAIANTDYTETSGSLTFNNGVVSQAFNIPILRNTDHTGNRYFNIALSLWVPDGGAELVSPSTAVATIIDSDPPPMVIPTVGLAFNATDMLVVAPMVISNGVAFQPITTIEGTNAAGYLAADVVIPAPGTYQIQVGVKAENEGSDSFWMTLGTTNDVFDVIPLTVGFENRWVNLRDGSTNLAAPNQWPYTAEFSAATYRLVFSGREKDTYLTNVAFILQADPPPAPQQIYLTSSFFWTYDSGVNAQVGVARVGSTGIATVDYGTIDGTAIAGVDYTTTNGTLQFNDGETNKVITIPVTNHPTYEGTKAFSLQLDTPVGAVLAFPTNCTISILDDLDPPVTVQGSVVSLSIPTLPSPSYVKAGALVPILVNVSSNAIVTGFPQLILNTGATATYASGSGSSNLVFNYTVGAGQATTKLEYLATDSLVLNGGTILSGGEPLMLALPPPGDTGSIGGTQTVVVDTTPPAIAIGTPAVETITGPVNITVTYIDANLDAITLSAGSIMLNTDGSANAANWAVSGSGNTRLVQLFGITGAGTLGISIAAGTATDLAGNVAGAAGPSPTVIVETHALTIIRGAVIRGGTLVQ